MHPLMKVPTLLCSGLLLFACSGADTETQEQSVDNTKEASSGGELDDAPEGTSASGDLGAGGDTKEFVAGASQPTVELIGSSALDKGTFGAFFITPDVAILDGLFLIDEDDALTGIFLSGELAGEAGVFEAMENIDFFPNEGSELDLEPFRIDKLETPPSDGFPTFGDDYQVLLFRLERTAELDEVFEVSFEFDYAGTLTAEAVVLQDAAGQFSDVLEIDMEQLRQATIEDLREAGLNDNEIGEILDELGY